MDVSPFIPGAAGSLVSMLWAKDVWWRMVLMWFGGLMFSYYSSAYALTVLHLDINLIKFLLGLFGMAIISSLVTGWQKVDLGGLMQEYFRKFLRLPFTPPAKDPQS